jgi:hypothetical protein
LPAGRTVGVVTYDAAALSDAHFAAAGVTERPPVAGLPRDGAFHGMIERGGAYDAAALEAELLAVVDGLIRGAPEIGAIVLECTNLPPFTGSVVARFGLPVFDILTLGKWLFASVSASPSVEGRERGAVT